MTLLSVFNGISLIRTVLKLTCSEKFIYIPFIEIFNLFSFCKHTGLKKNRYIWNSNFKKVITKNLRNKGFIFSTFWIIFKKPACLMDAQFLDEWGISMNQSLYLCTCIMWEKVQGDAHYTQVCGFLLQKDLKSWKRIVDQWLYKLG